ncbi:MAG: NTP transferase domain-containing protein [Clostridiales bacterium]|nr:NTP transferase domain-containing protein [Clostridiales bacterium]
MKAVVMAGGEGTRLRPLTSMQPKPMVPIVNQPVMEHILGLVRHHGIYETVATLAFMPRVIEDYFGNGEEWGMSIEYAREETPLGTAGSVKNAEHLLGDGTFIVISGDALTDIDLTEVIAFHHARGAAVTIALKSVADPLEFGVVITGEDGRIERFLEKPSWGQVFSDTINTGIYVIEPEVLAHVPAGEPFDFSSDLFPALMAAGYPLYGCVVDGYWCDVGSFDTYVQAHRDILDGRAKVYIPGVRAREGVWIGEGSRIEPDAVIGDKVVIGQNVTLRAGAVLRDHTVVGDNCVIGEQAEVTSSIVWSDCFIGRQARVSGAVLCRKVDVRSGAAVEIGSVIGDETSIGQGARVAPHVSVYPLKRIEPAADVTTSIIWESTVTRGLFGQNGVTGVIGADITPEIALWAAQAFGSLLPKGSHVVVSRDGSRAARMLKRAMVAGLNAAACHVRDLRAAAPALTRFTTRDTRCVAGIHVASLAGDPQSVRIEFFDANGLDIAQWEEKKLERLFYRKEFRRAFLEDVGEIAYPPRSLEYYAAGMARAVDGCVPADGPRRTVIADLDHGTASLVLPQVAASWGINLIAFNPFLDAEKTQVSRAEVEDAGRLRYAVELFGADLGVRFDPSGERVVLITPSGRELDSQTALHAVVDLWCRTDTDGGAVAVPLTASVVIDHIAEKCGREVLRPGMTRRSLATLVHEGVAGLAGAADGGFMFGRFLAAYDAAMSVGMIACMLGRAGVTLDDVVDGLPPFHTREVRVACPAHRKGTVMRIVSTIAAERRTEVSEGIRIAYDDGWALVVPHSREPLVYIWAEGSSAPSAESIIRRWTEIVENAI